MIYQIIKYLRNNIINKTINVITYPLQYKKKYLECKQNYEQLKKHIIPMTLKPAEGKLRDLQLANMQFAIDLFSELEQIGIKPFMRAGTLLGAERHGGYIPWDDDMDFGLFRNEYLKIIEYAKTHHVLELQKGDRLNFYFNRLKITDNLLKKYPNKCIFWLRNDMIQVLKGTSLNDYVKLDLFSFDFYNNNYSFENYKKYVKEIEHKINWIDNFEKEINFLQNEIKNNANIVNDSNKISYGIDHASPCPWLKLVKWWDRADFLPLKKMKFENVEFYAPNNHIKLLNDWCPRWRELPKDIIPKHEKDFPMLKESKGNG